MKARNDPKLRPSCVRVYEAVRRRIRRGQSPTHFEVASDTSLSIQTVSMAVATLIAAGYLTNLKHRTRSLQLVDPDLRLTAMPVQPWEEDLSEPRIWDETPTPERVE